MSVTIRPSSLETLLKATIKARLPVLITGSPGIGKTDIVHQAAADAGHDILVSHPVVEDPTDAKGIPWPNSDSKEAVFLPMGNLAVALKVKKPTVWFLDDLGQSPPAVQAAYMQLLLARSVNGHKLPDCLTFIAATNRRTDRAGVSGILEPVKSRFATIVELRPNLDDFVGWAFRHDINPYVIAFLRFKSDLLCDFKATADMTNSPCPRTWAFVSKLLGLGAPQELEFPMVAGAVGEGAAQEFISFIRLASQLPDPDKVLANPKQAEVPKEPSILHALVSSLVTKANQKNYAKVLQYGDRLMEHNQGEFATFLVKDMLRKLPDIAGSSEFVRMMTQTKLGRMFGVK